MFPALTLFYYGFLSEQDKKLYYPTVSAVYQQFDLSKEARHQVIQIRKRCTAKSGMTNEGKERKKRIVQKLFIFRKKTRLYLSFYMSVLPLLQRYVKTFEMTEPLIYKLNDNQVELLSDVLVCFVKPEVITKTQVLGALDVTSKPNLLPKKKMFVGKEAKDIMADDPVTSKFLDTVQQAYIQCTQQLQKKMPLDNQFLICVSAIDPTEQLRGHTETLHNLLKLPSFAKHVLSDDQIDEYELDCRRYVAKTDLPSFTNRADRWWSHSEVSGKFPVLTKMALSLLSCFHGPQVESSFSAMNQIIDPHSANLSIGSFQAYQTVRYHLKSVKKTSTDFFHKEDYKHDPADPHLCKNFTHAWHMQKEVQDQMKAKRQQKTALLNLQTKKQTSKRKFTQESEEAAKRSRLAHIKKLTTCKPTKKRTL